jgi:hypothetical protein
MAPYNEWLMLARRYDKAVDFGSPMSAWTPEMLKQHREQAEKKTPVQPASVA